MRTPTRATATVEAAIVSANRETLEGLAAYLTSVGVRARGCSRLEACAALAGPDTIAIVVFPDDFAWEAVLATLAELAARHARALRVLVTGHPKRFEHLGGRARTVVVSRPAWGWVILDAIRAHAVAREARPARAALARREPARSGRPRGSARASGGRRRRG